MAAGFLQKTFLCIVLSQLLHMCWPWIIWLPKQCEYLMTVNTGPTRGPNFKLAASVEAYGGDNIKTTNLIKRWGIMGKGYTYFLPNTSDRFRHRGRCMPANFCNIGIYGGEKGELKPHWHINNITVATTGEGGINRFRTFTFLNYEITRLPIDDGECP
ncbi:hypothetical protein ACHQM5_003386 [Ranunculus cassubicifolius]